MNDGLPAVVAAGQEKEEVEEAAAQVEDEAIGLPSDSPLPRADLSQSGLSQNGYDDEDDDDNDDDDDDDDDDDGDDNDDDDDDSPNKLACKGPCLLQ